MKTLVFWFSVPCRLQKCIGLQIFRKFLRRYIVNQTITLLSHLILCHELHYRKRSDFVTVSNDFVWTTASNFTSVHIHVRPLSKTKTPLSIYSSFDFSCYTATWRLKFDIQSIAAKLWNVTAIWIHICNISVNFSALTENIPLSSVLCQCRQVTFHSQFFVC